MSVQSRISSFIEVANGDTLMITRSASKGDSDITQISHSPGEVTLAALVSNQKLNLCEIINVDQVFIEVYEKTDPAFFINVKFGATTNTDVPVKDFIAFTTEFVNDPDPLSTTGVFVSNPNNTEVKIKVTIVGTE